MIRNTLIEMGHPQPPTPVQTDNSFAKGFSNRQVKQGRSKAIDIRFYWIQDRVKQGQFYIYWQKGIENMADYFTNHYPARHHRHMREIFSPKFIKLILHTTPISKILSIKLTFNSHFNLTTRVCWSVPLGSLVLNPSALPAWEHTGPESLYTHMYKLYWHMTIAISIVLSLTTYDPHLSIP